MVVAPPLGSSPLDASNTNAAASAFAYDDRRGEHDPLRILNRSSRSPDFIAIYGYDDPANLAHARTGAFGLILAAKSAPAVVRGGETAATRYGREIHRTFDYGPGFRREFTLPSGRRADAVNLRIREVVELKPNNPRAIAQGRRQLEAYAAELEELYPGMPFTRRLETYDRP